MTSPYIKIKSRKIGADFPPFVIAEIGINHGGDVKKAKRMIDDAKEAGAECVKFQCHVIEDEMIPAAKKIVPGHAKESIWKIMADCAFSEAEDLELKNYAEKKGLIYLSTPFSRAAADRLERMNVKAFKIGSGECNNYPLIKHIAAFGKPIILSTGMNDLRSIKPAVRIIEKAKVLYAILHCTSMYPTPYGKVRLGALMDLSNEFPKAVIGLSDHSLGNYTSYAAVALGASIIEKHFTSSKKWEGADIAISIDPRELKELVMGTRAVFEAGGGSKTVLKEESDIIKFAYASVVSTENIKAGDVFSGKNLWVKRPGTGEIKAVHFESLLGKKARCGISKNQQLKWRDIEK